MSRCSHERTQHGIGECLGLDEGETAGLMSLAVLMELAASIRACL